MATAPLPMSQKNPAPAVPPHPARPGPPPAAWIDLDNDGKLDLVVLRYVQWDWDDVYCGEHREGYRAYCHPDIFPAIRPLVYHNNGNGTFTEIGEKSGISKPGKGLGIALADFEPRRTGSTSPSPTTPCRSSSTATRATAPLKKPASPRRSPWTATAAPTPAWAIDFQDYDNDGLPDLVITNLANQKYALYRNNGDGSFSYDTYLSGLARMTLLHSGWGIHFFDYDNDGLKDLLVTQGHDLDTVELNYPAAPLQRAHAPRPQPGRRASSSTSPATPAPAFQQPWVGRGMAVGDLNNDGRLDAVVSTNDGPAHILLNGTATPNHWLTVNLVGHTSNRDAIGATIKLTTAHGAQYVTVSTAGSYLSSNDKARPLWPRQRR